MILDNLVAHKTKQVQRFLSDHPTVPLHFTPTYCSCLNQVELWFAKIERDVIARRTFSSFKASRHWCSRSKMLKLPLHYFMRSMVSEGTTMVSPGRRIRLYRPGPFVDPTNLVILANRDIEVQGGGPNDKLLHRSGPCHDRHCGAGG